MSDVKYANCLGCKYPKATHGAHTSPIVESDSAFAEFYDDLTVNVASNEHAFSGTRCVLCYIHEDDETLRPCMY